LNHRAKCEGSVSNSDSVHVGRMNVHQRQVPCMGERLTPLFPKYRCPLCQMLKPSQLTVKVHPPLATSRGQQVDVAVTGA